MRVRYSHREAGLRSPPSQIPRGFLRHRVLFLEGETVSSPASLWNKYKGEYTGGWRSGDKFFLLGCMPITGAISVTDFG